MSYYIKYKDNGKHKSIYELTWEKSVDIYERLFDAPSITDLSIRDIQYNRTFEDWQWHAGNEYQSWFGRYEGN